MPKSDLMGKQAGNGRATRRTFLAFSHLQNNGRRVFSERRYIVTYFLKRPGTGQEYI